VAGDVLIYVEHENGRPKRIALELASKAAELAAVTGGSVAAVVLGPEARSAAGRLGAHGVDDLYISEDAAFDQYLTEPQVDALAQVVADLEPATILFPYTPDGKDIAARLSARLDSGLVTNVIGLSAEDGRLLAQETVFGGTYTTTVEVRDSRVAMYLVRPNAFPLRENRRESTIHEIAYQPREASQRARRGKKVQEEGAPVPLEEAGTIVSGGRGLGGPEPFGMLQELANALDGALGASRAAVDAGWISYEHQVGQTGRTVKPQLYVAIGISGAVQHRVGMQTADTIVAINRDSDAPIFQLADLSVVGDLFQLVPALTEEVKKRKGDHR